MITFAIIKPHAVKNPVALNQILRIIEANNFKILKKSQIKFDQRQAENFYSEHQGKFYFNRLVSFMTSGPSEVLVLQRENAILMWRQLLGPTKVFKSIYSHPESIRGLFGLTDTRNCCHGSDSPESVAEEIKKVFPDFKLDEVLSETN